MFPRVSILIPTYNRPHYLEQALKSALNQTYRHIEIVICDNSDNDQTEQIVKQYMLTVDESKIKYARNTQNIGPVANQHKCFDLSTGEYINYLMDDDLFHPEKIEKMMHYFLMYDDITLVTSAKQKININGQTLAVYSFFQEDTIMDGIEMGNLLLKKRRNFIGEPTTVLFRKQDLDEPFGMFAGKQAENSVDVASWLNLCKKGRAVYIAEPLSSSRAHSQQLSRIEDSKSKRVKDWVNFIKDAPSKGFFIDK